MSLLPDGVMLVETEDYLLLPLNGSQAYALRMDYAFTVCFSEIELLLSCPFKLLLDGIEHLIDPSDMAQVATALHVLRKEGAGLVAHHDGRVELRFRDGTLITAECHPSEEAWEIDGSDGLHVVCLPGGELAIWRPDSLDDEPV